MLALFARMDSFFAEYFRPDIISLFMPVCLRCITVVSSFAFVIFCLFSRWAPALRAGLGSYSAGVCVLVPDAIFYITLIYVYIVMIQVGANIYINFGYYLYFKDLAWRENLHHLYFTFIFNCFVSAS